MYVCEDNKCQEQESIRRQKGKEQLELGTLVTESVPVSPPLGTLFVACLVTPW
jgi:hypothetical protein